MQTRSKSGIFKPKIQNYVANFLTETKQILSTQEPLCMKEALSLINWKQAMEANNEYLTEK